MAARAQSSSGSGGGGGGAARRRKEAADAAEAGGGEASEEHAAALRALQQGVAEEAREVLRAALPRKVLELDALLASLPPAPPHAGLAEHGGEVKSNEAVRELGAALAAHLRQCVVWLDALKLWVQLRVPVMQDGNNFGVEVQEEVSELIVNCRSACYAMLDLSSFYLSRAKLASKAQRFPRLADYRRCGEELDTREWFTLRRSVAELRNNLAITVDTVQKNLERIERPRGANAGPLAMY